MSFVLAISLNRTFIIVGGPAEKFIGVSHSVRNCIEIFWGKSEFALKDCFIHWINVCADFEWSKGITDSTFLYAPQDTYVLILEVTTFTKWGS